MKYTLLQLTQAVLSSMDSDEITSINDTTESQQVVKIIRSVYFDIINRADLPEHYGLINLVASSDTTKPVIMSLPTTVAELLWLKYDNATLTDTDVQMRPVVYQDLETFLLSMHTLDESATNVDSFSYTADGGTYDILYYNDKVPQYYTSIDDNTFIFDSIDLTVDTTVLQSSKTLGYARLIITWTDSDTFTPDLDEPQFSLLLNEAKSLAWAELKQTQHAKAEVSARRGWSTLQKSKHATEVPSFFDKLPNYGRK